jgi:pre-rRNA-processing protein TSR1
MDIEPTLIVEPDVDEADSLISSNDPDDMANEQTWPTEEEMNNVPGNDQERLPDALKRTTPKIVKRIPKGMSEYQAAWIVDETDDEEDTEEGEERKGGDHEMEEQEEQEEMVDLVIGENKDMESEIQQDADFEDLDLEEERKQWVSYWSLDGYTSH